MCSTTKRPSVELDVFLSRAHALAVPYLLAPAMSFLVYLSPYAYYCLRQPSSQNGVGVAHDADTYMKLDIPFSRLRSLLSQRKTRPEGATTATLTLTSIPKSITPSFATLDLRHFDPHGHSRPFFRLPGTSHLTSLNHTLLTRVRTNVNESAPVRSPESASENTEQVWMLDFTDGGRSAGIILSHTRMREIQQVIDPASAAGALGLGVTMPPMLGNWVGLLVSSSEALSPYTS